MDDLRAIFLVGTALALALRFQTWDADAARCATGRSRHNAAVALSAAQAAGHLALGTQREVGAIWTVLEEIAPNRTADARKGLV